MAIDECVMCFVREKKVLPTIRFYQWDPPCLSLGYAQSLSEIDSDNCKSRNVNIVRRVTGGRAVLHDAELTYSVVAPQKFFPKSLSESFIIISSPILKTLNQFGMKCSFSSCHSTKPRTPICFQEKSSHEITISGKKIVGSAQARIGGTVLQHGSIMLDFNADKLCSLFKTESYSDEVKKTASKVTSIKHELKRDIDLYILKSKLVENFQIALSIKLNNDKLTNEELLFAKNLEEKYRNV